MFNNIFFRRQEIKKMNNNPDSFFGKSSNENRNCITRCDYWCEFCRDFSLNSTESCFFPSFSFYSLLSRKWSLNFKMMMTTKVFILTKANKTCFDKNGILRKKIIFIIISDEFISDDDDDDDDNVSVLYECNLVILVSFVSNGRKKTSWKTAQHRKKSVVFTRWWWHLLYVRKLIPFLLLPMLLLFCLKSGISWHS